MASPRRVKQKSSASKFGLVSSYATRPGRSSVHTSSNCPMHSSDRPRMSYSLREASQSESYAPADRDVFYCYTPMGQSSYPAELLSLPYLLHPRSCEAVFYYESNLSLNEARLRSS